MTIKRWNGQWKWKKKLLVNRKTSGVFILHVFYVLPSSTLSFFPFHFIPFLLLYVVVMFLHLGHAKDTTRTVLFSFFLAN